MLDPAEQYKQLAAECRQLAAMASDADAKSFWLRTADDWQKVINLVEERAASRLLEDREAGLGSGLPPALDSPDPYGETRLSPPDCPHHAPP